MIVIVLVDDDGIVLFMLLIGAFRDGISCPGPSAGGHEQTSAAVYSDQTDQQRSRHAAEKRSRRS
jgi:hypothetical protein